MKIIKLAKSSEICCNHNSEISIEKNSEVFTCHVCSKFIKDQKLLCCDNSNGDNNSVCICRTCCEKIFNTKLET